MTFTAFNAKTASTNTFVNRTSTTGFNAPEVPDADGENYVQLVLLQRKRTEGKDSDDDCRQRIQGPDGRQVIVNRVLFDLVGVIVNGQCYPDYTGKQKLPKPGTQEFRALMNTPSGLKVRSLYAGGLDQLKQLIKDGDIPMSMETLEAAIEKNTLNNLLGTMGAFLDAAGLIETKELTIGQAMMGGQTINVSMLSEGMGDTFAEGIRKLRGKFNFQNVALTVTTATTFTATDLTPNGRVQTTYTPDEVYFEWSKVEGQRGATEVVLNPDYAISGAKFSLGTTTAKGTEDLVRRGVTARHDGAAAAVVDRSNTRDLARQGSQARAFGGPVKTNGAGVPAGMVEIDDTL